MRACLSPSESSPPTLVLRYSYAPAIDTRASNTRVSCSPPPSSHHQSSIFTIFAPSPPVSRGRGFKIACYTKTIECPVCRQLFATLRQVWQHEHTALNHPLLKVHVPKPWLLHHRLIFNLLPHFQPLIASPLRLLTTSNLVIACFWIPPCYRQRLPQTGESLSALLWTRSTQVQRPLCPTGITACRIHSKSNLATPSGLIPQLLVTMPLHGFHSTVLATRGRP